VEFDTKTNTAQYHTINGVDFAKKYNCGVMLGDNIVAVPYGDELLPLNSNRGLVFNTVTKQSYQFDIGLEFGGKYRFRCGVEFNNHAYFFPSGTPSCPILVIDENGNYFGGVISPGVNLSVEALSMAAAKLPRVAVEKPKKIIGNSTISAIQSGIFYGYLSMVEGMVMRITEEFGRPMKVLATGGLATLFNEATDVIEIVDQELTTYGLFEIYWANQK
jgi:hypothetical protein